MQTASAGAHDVSADDFHQDTKIHAKILAAFDGSGIEVSEAHGAWYVLLDFSKFTSALNVLDIRTSPDLATYLAENERVVLIPGSEFGFDEDDLYVRFSYVDLSIVVNEDETKTVDDVRILQLCEKLVKFVTFARTHEKEAKEAADEYFDEKNSTA